MPTDPCPALPPGKDLRDELLYLLAGPLGAGALDFINAADPSATPWTLAEARARFEHVMLTLR